MESGYNEKIADLICERMINGETIAAICADPDMPSRRTVYDWQDAHPEFRTRCARAREGMADAYEQRMQEVVEGVQTGAITSDVARVVLSHMQWRASKAAPKSFGDKITSEITGKDGGAIEVNSRDVTQQVLSKLPQGELEKLIENTASKDNG